MSGTDLSHTTSILKSIWDFTVQNYYHRQGLAAQLILSAFVVGLAGPRILDESVALDVRIGVYSASWAIISTVATFAWLLNRRLPRFTKRKAGVLFATKHDAELHRELANLHDRVIDEIAHKDLCQLMAVKTAPPNHSIRCHQEALRMLTITGGRVLIWGSFQKATYQGRELHYFPTISFTCSTLPREMVEKGEIWGDSLFGRKWGWETTNSLESSIVATNLAEVARYVVGLSLLSEQRYRDAQPILGLLHVELRTRHESRRVPAPVARFQETVKQAYMISLLNEVAQLYNHELYEDRLFAVGPAILSEWERKASEALRLDENVSNARLLLAIIAFLKGDIRGSKALIVQERQRFPGSRAACDFSDAFLATFCEDYREAKRIYKRATKDPRVTEPRFLQPILSFLEQATAKYPDKPGLLFVLGLLNHELHDSLRAQEAFEQFLKQGAGKDSLAHWLREAHLRLRRIPSDLSKDMSSADAIPD